MAIIVLHYLYLTAVLFLLLCGVAIGQENRTKPNVSGKIIDSKTEEPISYAIVILSPWNIQTISDINGEFSITATYAEDAELLIKHLGYIDYHKEFNITESVNFNIKLQQTTLNVGEVTVMAKKKLEGDKVEIDQLAIEYIQPTSLHDILLLLPGSVYSANSMSNFQTVSMRQAGSDSNSGLGLAITIDGVPQTSDGMRSQMVGFTDGSTTSSTDSEMLSRSGMNQGTDLRYLSTDHIESVEVTKGIASAKYGNLSSGMIQVNSKKGESPLRVRLKTDLSNKLAYVGKGILLPNDKGTLNIGADYLVSAEDPRDAMDKFTRLTAQALYNRVWMKNNGMFELDLRLNQTISTNTMKKDELTYEYNEEYNAEYSKSGFMAKGVLTNNAGWLNRLDLTASVDYTDDKVSRYKRVISSTGALSVPLATEEGENEGMYLSSLYYSRYYLENIPINLHLQANALTKKELTNDFFVNLEYGAEYNMSKNIGDGAVIEDPTLPPFPQDNTYMRPRANYTIPAIMNLATYLQSNWNYKIGDNSLNVGLGARFTQMLNLSEEYSLRGYTIFDPRFSTTLNIGSKDSKVRHAIRAGVGVENKLPTLDYLYPESVYKDFYVMNYYSSNSAYRRLITYTNIYDVTNYDIKPNKNTKFEIGYDIGVSDCIFSFTGFYEKSNDGFEYYSSYTPVNYTYYYELSPEADVTDRIPEKSDFLSKDYSLFYSTSKVENSQSITKKGLEYRFVFPKIEQLYTQIEVNGAYYSTDYGTSLPMEYYPGIMIADTPYQYVGVYDEYPYTQKKQLNTNIWFNTHFPQFGLMLTNFFQFVWIESEQYFDNGNIIPSYLIDTNGSIIPVEGDIYDKINNKEAEFVYLNRSIDPLNYALYSEPIYMMWTLKATKEFKNRAKLSLFVNNIIDINPVYTSGNSTTDRTWVNPNFGIELFVNF
ncbi:MAG: carboxypeptidase-like regulatory domain-containing protein [Rikenellaceae bacterium]